MCSFILAKDGHEDAEPAALVIKNEAVILHVEVNLGEVFIIAAKLLWMVFTVRYP
jgi:hypothetical protein